MVEQARQGYLAGAIGYLNDKGLNTLDAAQYKHLVSTCSHHGKDVHVPLSHNAYFFRWALWFYNLFYLCGIVLNVLFIRTCHTVQKALRDKSAADSPPPTGAAHGPSRTSTDGGGGGGTHPSGHMDAGTRTSRLSADEP